MDFTPELSGFQGAIISTDNVHPFSRLTSRGGNQEKIEYVLENLKKFLKNQRFVNESGIIEATKPKLRKFAMYIILNADLPVLEEMVGMEGVDMVIWTIPTVPKHLMCELLWNLHMEEFIYEIITYGNPELAISVADAFIYHFKYFTPNDCLQKLHGLSFACYKFIGQFNRFALPNETMAHMLISAMDNLHKCLLYYPTPPNSHRLNMLTKDQLYLYNGRALHALLLLICECFDYFTQDTNWTQSDDIYKATFKDGCLKEVPFSKISETQDPTIQENLINSNKTLLDIFQVIVMGVSVDIFCAWSEYEEGGISMQQSIGELCDKVRTKLLTIESVADHPVVNMIQQMARKPINIDDTINSVEANVIIQKINSNDQDKSLWIHALMNRHDLFLYGELLHTMDTYLHTFNEKECLKLYHKFTEYLHISSNNLEIIKSLVVKAFYQCNITDKHQILQKHFTNNCFFDMTDDEQFQNRFTETLNKLVTSADIDCSELLCAFLQNPKEVYIKTLLLAADNGQLTNTILNIMKLLEHYSSHYYNNETEPCIINTIKLILDNSLQTDKQRENFVKFICGLKNIDIVPKTKLLLFIIMPVMHKALVNKDITKLNVQIHLLTEAYTIEELVAYRAPMLAMMGQVIEVVRWMKLDNFTPNAPMTLQLGLCFLNNLIKTYNNTVPDVEGSWLRIKLKQMNPQPINNFYFSVLWTPRQPGLFDFVTRTNNFRDVHKNEVSVWLTHIISTGTQDEWCKAWDEMSQQIKKHVIVGIFHESMRMITRTVEENHTEAPRACLLYCYSNLVYIIRYKFFEEPLTDAQVTCCVNNLTRLLEGTNVQDVSEIGTRLMPLLGYLAERKNDYTIDINIKFKHTKYSELVNRVFSNGSI